MTIARWQRWPGAPLAAAVLVLGQYGAWTAGGGSVHGPRWAVALAAGLGALALARRIRRPLPVVAAVCVTSLAPALAWGTSELLAFVASGAVALFACGRYAARPYAVAGAIVGFATALGLDALAPAERLASSWTFALWMPALVAAGMWVRQQGELARRRAELAAEHERLLAAEHRLALARDLHDSLSNSLAIIVLQAEAAELTFTRDPVAAGGALTEVTAAGRRALGQIRQFVTALRTAAPGPRSAVLQQVLDQVRAAGLTVTATGLLELEPLPERAAEELSRVLQESLTNALRHAGPVAVRVEVTRSGDALTLTVDNDGDVLRWPPERGHGLQGMRERVTALGGTLSAEPRPGGFTVRARIPVTVAADAGSPMIAGNR